MARLNGKEIEAIAGTISKWFVAGTTGTLGERVATAEPAAEQMGQMWEAVGVAARSVQKWNCAPMKITESNKARMPM